MIYNIDIPAVIVRENYIWGYLGATEVVLSPQSYIKCKACLQNLRYK